MSELVKCECCGGDVEDDYVGRVCSYQLDDIVSASIRGYNNYPTCNCCSKCYNSACKGFDDNKNATGSDTGEK